MQVVSDGVVWLSDAVRAWSKSTRLTTTLWTPAGPLRAFAANEFKIVVAEENGEVWRLDRDGAHPTKVAEGQDRVIGIRSVGDQFYWANFGDSKLMRVGPDGMAQEIRHDTCYPNDLIVVNDTAYSISGACRGILGFSFDSAIEPRILFQDLGGSVTPARAATNESSIAWLNYAAGDMRITSLPDGATNTLYTFGPNPVLPSGGKVEGLAVAIDTSHVYYATANEGGSDDGFVYKIAATGGTPERVSDEEVKILSVSVDESVLAWTAYGVSDDAGRIVLRVK